MRTRHIILQWYTFGTLEQNTSRLLRCYSTLLVSFNLHFSCFYIIRFPTSVLLLHGFFFLHQIPHLCISISISYVFFALLYHQIPHLRNSFFVLLYHQIPHLTISSLTRLWIYAPTHFRTYALIDLRPYAVARKLSSTIRVIL